MSILYELLSVWLIFVNIAVISDMNFQYLIFSNTTDIGPEVLSASIFNFYLFPRRYYQECR